MHETEIFLEIPVLLVKEQEAKTDRKKKGGIKIVKMRDSKPDSQL